MQWTIRRLRAWSVPWLQQRGIDNPRLDSDLLLADALGIRRIDLFLDPDRPVSQVELAAFKQHVQRRARREPVAYILGNCGFWQQTFTVTPDVLIPRPETELLVEAVLETFPDSPQEIWEVGVGSGALLCSLLLEYPKAQGTGTDISATALAIAEHNLKQHDCLERTTLLRGDLAEAMVADSSLMTTHDSCTARPNKHFQVIVSNPPYVSTAELATLEPEVREWEPHQALDGGVHGLEVLRRLPSAVAPFLACNGLLALEIGATQAEAVCQFMTTAGYRDVTLREDFGRRPRIITGRRYD